MTHPIIKTDNYILITSDEEIKGGNYFYKKAFNRVAKDGIIEMSGTGDKKIIAHLPLNNSSILEGVPLLPPLPNEEDEIIENLENYLLKVNQLYKDWLGIGFKGGYHKAKEKYKFTEEDMRKVLSEAFKASQEGYQITSDEIISSLSQPKLPVAFKYEMEKDYRYNCDGEPIGLKVHESNNPKIINGVIQGEWIF